MWQRIDHGQNAFVLLGVIVVLDALSVSDAAAALAVSIGGTRR